MTRPRFEKQVGGQLTEYSFENLVPMQRQLRQWRDRKKWVEIPLFYSYIFVCTSERRRNEVFKIYGLTKYLSFGGQICTVTANEIERIKRLCSYDGKVIVEQGRLQHGDIVEIIEGHFAGLHGQVLSTSKKQKIRLSIASLNCIATIELSPNNVQKKIA